MSTLVQKKKHAAGALFALALNQVQIHQTRTSGNTISTDSFSNNRRLWVHESSGLLRPIFRFLDIDSATWPSLEEIATTSSVKHQVGSFLQVLAEGDDDTSKEISEKEIALSKAVDAMALSLETSSEDFEDRKEKHRAYAHERKEKFSGDQSTAETKKVYPKNGNEKDHKLPTTEQGPTASSNTDKETAFDEVSMLGDQRIVAVLYELLSACLADTPEDDNKSERPPNGYDARHRAALRLLTVWFDIRWINMEAIEVVISCSAIAMLKQGEGKENEDQTSDGSWEKWKRGSLIGAAAITGGTLMAITGGLAAPAIASGVGALAPTLGTVVPVIGAGGFAAVASATGSVAGSVAVAASFGAAGAGLTGTKMARRIGSVDEFEFKAIGENHNQGRLAVEIMVAGFVFEEQDFLRPWEGQTDSLERYALQWESQHLIAISTAIQDFLASKIALELMKQGAMMTVLSSLLAALSLPATLLTLTDLIDSKWSIAVDRSDKAGKLLAEVLVKGLQGNRPVTLVGFSLGARVIFKCLQNLAETNHDGLVERVVLLGAPVPIKDENWESVRKVVCGRLINAYSTSDWMLGVAFRASLFSQGLAGIQPVDVPGIENVDVTTVIEGHSCYLWGSREILERLTLDTYYPVFKKAHTKH